VRNYGYGIGFRHGSNFAGLRNAAHMVGIELDVIKRVSFQQLSEAVKRELMLMATGNVCRSRPMNEDYTAELVNVF
jgi:hypothetical protein